LCPLLAARLVRSGHASASRHYRVWACGANQMGQLGLGDRVGRQVPTPIPELDGKKIVSIGCTGYFGSALTEDGSVFCWGSGQFEGRTQSVPVPTEARTLSAKNVTEVHSGRLHQLYRCSDGRLFVHGDSQFGQTGTGKKGFSAGELFPREIMGFDARISTVATGYDHNLAVSEDGRVWVWGFNQDGQLGLGDQKDRTKPVDLEGLFHKHAEKVFCGPDASAVVTKDGEVYMMGASDVGQLGQIFDTAVQATPQRVPLTGKPVCMAIGLSWTFALMPRGDVWVWGQDRPGFLRLRGAISNDDIVRDVLPGEDYITQRMENNNARRDNARGFVPPERHTGLSGMGVVDMRSSNSHVLFRTADGYAAVMGRNAMGEVAMPVGASAHVPSFISNLPPGERVYAMCAGDCTTFLCTHRE